MKITVKIDTDTPAGKHLESELRRYPESVEFIEPSVVADTNTATHVEAKDIFEPIDEQKDSISAAESAKLAFSRLGKNTIAHSTINIRDEKVCCSNFSYCTKRHI